MVENLSDIWGFYGKEVHFTVLLRFLKEFMLTKQALYSIISTAVKMIALHRCEGSGKMAKDLKITFLLDFYGDMLTDKQREVIECYYNEDLSLAEIALDRNITRQGVRDAIKRAEQQLLEMEERLGLAKRFKAVQDALTVICDCAVKIQDVNREHGDHAEIADNVAKILEYAQEIAMDD